MGAGNVLRAYDKYAGKVPPLSMVLLAYMAAVSKDTDTAPWFGMGHEALAERALGRPAPVERADVKAVERAVAPLLAAGAIVADRRAAPRSGGAKTVRYRLMLDGGDVPRNPGEESGERPPESVQDVPRFPGSRPPESVQSSPGNRGTEEEEETGGVGEEEGAGRLYQRARSGPRADERRRTDRQHSGNGRTPGADDELVEDMVWGTGATLDEARRMIARVRAKHNPGDLAAYLHAMARNGDLPELRARVLAETPAPGPRTSKPWDRGVSEVLGDAEHGQHHETATRRGAALARDLLTARRTGG